MEGTRVLYSYREFLNSPEFHGAGFILTDVIERDDEYGEETTYTSVRLTIADCDRRINFGIDLGQNEIDNSLYKLDTMIEGLRGLRREVAKVKRSYGRKRA